MYPGHADGFEWDEANERHLARRHISAWEVEEVFENGPVWACNKKDQSGDWKMVGTTSSGRALAIIVSLGSSPDLLRAITGWDASAGDKTRYLAKRSGRR